MRQTVTHLEVASSGKGLYDFTIPVVKWVAQSQIQTGLLTLFCQHTSASLTIQENADPDVIADLRDFFERIVPENDPRYRHTMEGPDDMPAHIRAALTQIQLSISVMNGRPALGTWQGIYLFEHRSYRTRRSIALHLIGD